VRYHEDSLRFWLNRGLDGFRLDAVPHLIENDNKNWNDQPESRALTKRLVDLVHRRPGRYVVCEATAKPDDWGDPAVCGGAFAFGYVHHFVDAARGKADSVKRLAEHFRTVSPRMATFVSNHDHFAGQRLMDQLDGDEAKVKLAAAGYLLQPGTPFVYYGEEVGMRGAKGSDPDHPLRSPMSWLPDVRDGGFTRGTPFRAIAPNVATHNARTQAADPNSIFSFYKAMIGLRNAHPSIARGSFEHSFADGLLLGFQRRFEGDHTLVLINYGATPASANVKALPTGARLVSAYPATSASARADAAGAAHIELPAQSVRVFRIRR
jgi:glycosidase